MRGHRRRLAVVTMVVVALTGCQPDPSNDSADDATAEVRATSSYEDWTPEYADVRPATDADLEGLRTRVHDVNASSYTASLDELGAEVASTPEHVRIRFGELDLHLDPDRVATEDEWPYVLCSADEATCVDVGPDASPDGAPHMFNNYIDSFVFILAGIVEGQLLTVDDLGVREASYATIDSPLGTLDCLVSGGTAEERAGLEGQPVELSPDPVVASDEPLPLFPVCVDQRGLVIVAPSLLAPVAPYSSFETGVPAGFDEHADPVPYGSTPSPTSEAASPDPDELQTVLVATGTIAVGESLGDALAAGKLSLEYTPGDSALTGALASVAGLEDRVALVEIAVGAQITEDDFGFPTMADLQALGVTPALYDAVRRAVARDGYGTSPGVAPMEREMLILAYRFVHRCAAVTDGTTTWKEATIDDVTDDSPNYDQALHVAAYLEETWCPAVLG